MIRRDFLRRLAVGATGLLIADDVLELLVEPERRFWPGAELVPAHYNKDLARRIERILWDRWRQAELRSFLTSGRPGILAESAGPGDYRIVGQHLLFTV